jgi:hypothetical protein
VHSEEIHRVPTAPSGATNSQGSIGSPQGELPHAGRWVHAQFENRPVYRRLRAGIDVGTQA